jgi:predicted nuclease of predicted toxin-antitoxin system
LTKFLADENIPTKTVQTLKQKGVDIISILETSHGLKDTEVLDTANRQGRILITFDTDFGNLVIKQKLQTRGIILLRTKPKSPQQITKTIEQVLATKKRIEDHFIVVREYGIRILPIKQTKNI